MTKQIAERTKEIDGLQKTFSEIKEAHDTLTKKPTDPAANLIYGKYACLVKGEWDEGLTMLAIGSDPKFRR